MVENDLLHVAKFCVKFVCSILREVFFGAYFSCIYCCWILREDCIRREVFFGAYFLGGKCVLVPIFPAFIVAEFCGKCVLVPIFPAASGGKCVLVPIFPGGKCVLVPIFSGGKCVLVPIFPATTWGWQFLHTLFLTWICINIALYKPTISNPSPCLVDKE